MRIDGVQRALIWSAWWIILAFAFNFGVYYFLGSKQALEFTTGYLLEKSLSVDNVFVFFMVFNYFKISPRNQKSILTWGIIGALVMRGLFIFSSSSILLKFHWLIYMFGGFLVFTGVRMLCQGEEHFDSESSIILRIIKRVIPYTDEPLEKEKSGAFFIKSVETGQRMATKLFVVLVLIEIMDLVFALDSIPAILAVTNAPFIVYTSNIFAILGLRALYFAVRGVVNLFDYLRYGLAVILIFVGVKMLVSDIYHIPIVLTLFFISATVFVSIIVSLVVSRRTDQLQRINHNHV